MKTEKELAAMLATEIDRQNNYVSVISDGNRTTIRPVMTTRPANNIITRQWCADIVAKIEAQFGKRPKRISVSLTRYDYTQLSPADYEYVLSGDIGLGVIGHAVVARYDVDKKSLVIWRDGSPVYANDNGIICRDEAALADSLC